MSEGNKYKPSPTTTPASSTPVKIKRAAKGETPEGTFYYAYYITLFGGHNRTPRPSTTTTTYPHIISLFPACK